MGNVRSMMVTRDQGGSRTVAQKGGQPWMDRSWVSEQTQMMIDERVEDRDEKNEKKRRKQGSSLKLEVGG